jgi:hypothetical protein
LDEFAVVASIDRSTLEIDRSVTIETAAAELSARSVCVGMRRTLNA